MITLILLLLNLHEIDMIMILFMYNTSRLLNHYKMDNG